MRRTLSCLLLVACANDVSVTETARCDGVLQSSEGEALDGAFDRDGDGYFDADNADCAAAYPAEKLDCNDADATINPAGVEVACNDIDDDCDDTTVDSVDADGDGFGDATDGCTELLGADAVDCDDSDPGINPDASEVDCDEIDNDCDEETADGLDHDGDGYTECEDCADLTPGINPGVAETACNGVDDDCNTDTLDAPDGDGDGATTCAGDCDDGNALVSPLLDDVCDDGVDNDCDGRDSTCSVDGYYDLDTRIQYDCAYGYVDIDFDQVSILDTYPNISITAVGSGSQPGTMTGTWLTSSTYSTERELAGGCTETYNFEGEFTAADTFVGTFTASFTGRQCLDCTNQAWTGVVGTLR